MHDKDHATTESQACGCLRKTSMRTEADIPTRVGKLHKILAQGEEPQEVKAFSRDNLPVVFSNPKWSALALCTHRLHFNFSYLESLI